MRFLVLALLLAGCGSAAPRAPLPLRNPTAPVASQLDASVSRLSGDWLVVQGAGMAPGTAIRLGPTGARIGGASLPVSDTGKGRLTIGGDAVWVYWIDADNRTVAMGDPDGRRVWIMDRTGNPGERLRAAREILAWYGYDLARLEEI